MRSFYLLSIKKHTDKKRKNLLINNPIFKNDRFFCCGSAINRIAESLQVNKLLQLNEN